MSTASEEKTRGRILLLDLDPPVIEMLESELSGRDIEVVALPDPVRAREYLEKNPVAVVLADLDRTGEKAVHFLTDMRRSVPETSRFLFSDMENRDRALKLLVKGTITKYFEKPLEVEALGRKMVHVLKGRKILQNKSLVRMVHSIGELPALPRSYDEFMTAVDRDAPIREVAQILSRDISLATRILQIANSAYYHIHKIGSVERACIYLGLEKIKNIVFVVSLSSIRRPGRDRMKHVERIIAHSLKVNQHFHRIYRLEHKKDLPEILSSVGLTHDVGKIILLQNLPKRFLATVEYQKNNPDISFHRAEVEQGLEGVTHSEIGAYFLDLWNFPEVNVSTALYHHFPEEAEESERELMGLFSFANEVAKQA